MHNGSKKCKLKKNTLKTFFFFFFFFSPRYSWAIPNIIVTCFSWEGKAWSYDSLAPLHLRIRTYYMLPESSIFIHPLSLSIGHNFRYSTFACVPLSAFLNIQTESNKEDDMYYRTSKAWSPTLSTQEDPLVHGLETHSSSSISQFAPVNPGLQLHLYPWATSTHVASLLHGLDAQLKIAVMWSDVNELDKLHICSKIDYGYSL